MFYFRFFYLCSQTSSSSIADAAPLVSSLYAHVIAAASHYKQVNSITTHVACIQEVCTRMDSASLVLSEGREKEIFFKIITSSYSVDCKVSVIILKRLCRTEMSPGTWTVHVWALMLVHCFGKLYFCPYHENHLCMYNLRVIPVPSEECKSNKPVSTLESC